MPEKIRGRALKMKWNVVKPDINILGLDELMRDFPVQNILLFLLSNDNTPIGTARITRSGPIERFSILKPNRNKGLGSRLMNFIIDTAKENRFERIYLHSQMESIGFYKNLGFIDSFTTNIK